MYGTGRPKEGEDSGGVLGYLRRSGRRAFSLVKAKDAPTLPDQQDERPVLLFDTEDILVSHGFSPLRMHFVVKKRPHAGTFLFHLAHIYEIVTVTGSENYQRIFEEIDPYGCISYRLFLPDKRAFGRRNLNRSLSKTVCLASKENEYSRELQQNTINIGKWARADDSKLLRVLDFLVSLHFSGTADWRKTISSYRHKDFFSAFERTSRRMFARKHLFSLGADKKYEKVTEKIGWERVCEYERARRIMDEHVAKDAMANGGTSILAMAANVVKRFVFR